MSEQPLDDPAFPTHGDMREQLTCAVVAALALLGALGAVPAMAALTWWQVDFGNHTCALTSTQQGDTPEQTREWWRGAGADLGTTVYRDKSGTPFAVVVRTTMGSDLYFSHRSACERYVLSLGFNPEELR